jgi:hypothetical protein
LTRTNAFVSVDLTVDSTETSVTPARVRVGSINAGARVAASFAGTFVCVDLAGCARVPGLAIARELGKAVHTSAT